MPERGEVDGHRLRRSWVQLEQDVVARGRRLRRRRRASQVLPAVAALVVLVTALVVTAQRGDDRDLVRTGPSVTARDPLAGPLPALAFARFLDGGRRGSAIYVLQPGDAEPQRLTTDPSERDGAPAWSPDGGWIAFDSQRDNALRGVKTVIDVYLMRPDGSDVRRVTTTDVAGLGNGSQQPSWSPDGERLAVARSDEAGVGRIVTIRPDGSGARAVTDGPGDTFPAWSPDGRWIAFQRQDAEVWLVQPDGTGARRLGASDRPTRLSWTPDSRGVTFADGTRLVTIAVDDGARTIVAGGGTSEASDGAWLRDGALLAYSADPDGLHLISEEPDGTTTYLGGPEPGAIAVAEPGGRVRRTLTHPRRGDSDVNASFAPPAP